MNLILSCQLWVSENVHILLETKFTINIEVSDGTQDMEVSLNVDCESQRMITVMLHSSIYSTV